MFILMLQHKILRVNHWLSIAVITFIFTNLLTNKLDCQNNEFSFTLSGINSINSYNQASSRHESFSKFWAPTYTGGIEYVSKLHDKNLLLYTSLQIIGNATNVKQISYPSCPSCQGAADCPSCKKINVNSFSGNDDIGFLLGAGSVLFPKKKLSINAIGGVMVRYLFDYDSAPSGGAKNCTALGCYQAIAVYEKLAENDLHWSLFTRISWAYYRTKNNKFLFRLNLVGNLGLHSIYQTTSIIEDFTDGKSYNLVLDNYGSFLGIGISIGWER